MFAFYSFSTFGRVCSKLLLNSSNNQRRVLHLRGDCQETQQLRSHKYSKNGNYGSKIVRNKEDRRQERGHSFWIRKLRWPERAQLECSISSGSLPTSPAAHSQLSLLFLKIPVSEILPWMLPTFFFFVLAPHTLLGQSHSYFN